MFGGLVIVYANYIQQLTWYVNVLAVWWAARLRKNKTVNNVVNANCGIT